MAGKKEHLAPPFPKGVSGNPAGRPKGSRPRIAEAFLRDVHAIWEERGPAILQIAASTDPMAFAKMVSSLLPKEVHIQKAPEQELSDEQLASFLSDAIEARDRLAGSGDAELGDREAEGGAEAARRLQ